MLLIQFQQTSYFILLYNHNIRQVYITQPKPIVKLVRLGGSPHQAAPCSSLYHNHRYSAEKRRLRQGHSPDSDPLLKKFNKLYYITKKKRNPTLLFCRKWKRKLCWHTSGSWPSSCRAARNTAAILPKLVENLSIW